MPEPTAAGAAVPATQHAIQIVAAGEIVHNRAKPVRPRARRRSCCGSRPSGICFSDTKLLHAFTDHPRKGEVHRRPRPGGARGDPELRPRRAAHGPGPRGRRPDRRDRGARHAPQGRRARPRPDRLPPPPDGPLQRGLRLQLRGRAPGIRRPRRADGHRARDGRTVPHPRRRGARPPRRSRCWSRGHVSRPRTRCASAGRLLPAGRLLVVADRGPRRAGPRRAALRRGPACRDRRASADDAQAAAVEAALSQRRRPAVARGPSRASTGWPPASFDDIVYFGADADRIEALEDAARPARRDRHRARRRPHRPAGRGRRRAASTTT